MRLIVPLSLASLLVMPLQVQARVGILAKFADDVVMENLEVGNVYNLRTKGHLPYIVTNIGDKEAEVVVDINLPIKEALKPGYEPLADPGWVQVLPNKYQLKPGEQMVSEVIITIPDDKVYVNRSFQFSIWSHTVGSQFMAAGAEHRVRFSIGKGPESLASEKKRKAMFSLEFEVSPPSVYVPNVAPGKELDIKDERGLSLKLANKGAATIKVKPISVPFAQGINPNQGYEKAPDPSWLTCKPEAIKVGAMSIKEIKLFLKVPDEPQYYGKKYAFLVKTELQGAEVPLEMFSQVLVTVGNKQ